jgi:NAD(P)-dependent dehydrogenase (short-subunit alcohol dehydrogenase family)
MRTQVVLITGASRGFGEAAARELARRGHTVVATMRSPDRDGAKVAMGFEDQIHPTRLDVTSWTEASDAIENCVQKFGAIDAVINNAGYGLYGAVEDLGENEVARIFDTNFMGQWRLCKAALPYMRSRGSGRIVNVSSLGATLVAPLTGMYSATKAAVEAMTEALRYEVERFGISVTMIEPGMYKSDWQTSSLDVCAALRSGDSPYRESAERALTAFREMAMTRPGSDVVAATIADIVELEQMPPLRLPIGEDAWRLTQARQKSTDEEWEASIKQGPFFHGISPSNPEAVPGFSGY